MEDEERCPPHDFRAGWATNDLGRIYCRMCGDVRLLEPVTAAAPDLETVSVEADAS